MCTRVDQHLMLFDLETDGHHPIHIHHLLHDWPDTTTQLTLVVAPHFAARHPTVAAMPSKAHVTWLAITEAEAQWYAASRRSLAEQAWVEWRLYCRYAQKVQASQGLIMYIDRFQLPLALRFFLPCKTSGIFFRPKFHYRDFAKHRPARGERWRAWREQWLWWSALRHPQLQTLFSLDPLAVEPMRRLHRQATIVPLPDPVEITRPASGAAEVQRHALGIDLQRNVLLFFGMIDRRKGIYQVLEALKQLPPSQQERLTLLLVGTVAESECAHVMAIIDQIRHESPLQIVLQNCFVPEAAVPHYFALADLVLALYQHHVGSSGILMWAAATGKPVLASDYGLMGELVQRHKLGLAVDSVDPAAIAQQIVELISQPSVSAFDLISAQQFAAENSITAFVQTLWKNTAQGDLV